MTSFRALIGRFAGRLLVVAMGAALLIAIAAPVVAGSPPRERHGKHAGEHPGCHGTANAYSHVLANAAHDPEAESSLHDLRAVAEKKGCDLSGVEPAARPNDKGDQKPDGGGNGPPPGIIADKCDRIGDKLAIAETRPHGNSADAFARQAEKWSCPAR